jgi:hypothetical protein
MPASLLQKRREFCLAQCFEVEEVFAINRAKCRQGKEAATSAAAMCAFSPWLRQRPGHGMHPREDTNAPGNLGAAQEGAFGKKE